MGDEVEADVCVVGAGLRGAHRGAAAQPGRQVGRRARGARPRRRPHLDRAARRRHADRPRRRVARRRKHDAIFGLAGEVGVDDVQDVGRRARTCSSTATGPAATRASSRRSARSRSSRSRCAQLKIDRMAKQVPLDAPWTAKRAAEWDPRSVACVPRDARASAPTIARDLFEMAVRGLFTGDLDDVSFLAPAVPRARRTAASTRCSRSRGGAQENLVDGGAGLDRASGSPTSSATRCASARRCGRSRSATTASSSERGGRSIVTARHVVVTVPPALVLEIDVRSGAARRPARALPQRGRRPGDEDARRLRRAVLAGRRLQRPDRRSPARRPR